LKYRSYGGGALLKTLSLLYEHAVLSRKKAKQTRKSRTEAMQNIKYLGLTGGRNS